MGMSEENTIVTNQTDSPVAGLPLLYAAWMEEWLDGPIPAETNATCDNCAMLPPEGEAAALAQPEVFFNPRVKCCTYIPALPNFLVGRILADERPDMSRGRQSTLARLEQAEMANPLWLERVSTYDFKYTYRKKFFGQLDEMVCPHYIDEAGGLCGIWLHRNGVCTTWFCKHIRGDVAYRFWQALRDLFIQVEDELAQWCALELDIPLHAVRNLREYKPRGETIRLLEIEQAQPNLSVDTHRKIWGDWYGRETDYYIACGRLVEKLSWADVLAICGPQANTLARLVRQAEAERNLIDVPPRLRPGNFRIMTMHRDYTIVEGYLATDPLRVPPRVMELLPRFDGRPTAEVITEIALTSGLKVKPSLLRKLVDFKILVGTE
jgi:hypothetical protein